MFKILRLILLFMILSASQVKAPIIMECPLNIECKIRSSMLLGSHEMFIADIVAVNVDDSAFDKNGKIDYESLGLLAYAHGSYFGLVKQLGSFGFSVKKKKNRKDL